MEYFGNVVFEFSLADSIGVCLVPYDYHLHLVELSHHELEDYRHLSDRIRRLRLAAGRDPSTEDEERLQLLRIPRWLILEAAKGKLEVLESLLLQGSTGQVQHTLVYATDKDPGQLDAVNDIIRSTGLRFHQITAQETGNAKLVDAVLDAFRSGGLKVLTAKRVLDEGLNVPEISTAIILASTTVERQWVQRRGRVLRMCAAIGKEYATIHDFLVLPPPGEPRDDDIRILIGGELARCDEFANLARNRA
ncbi:MAG: helicase-related protein, partial [Gemmatimonadetes bacterium]|nr:helicase-related protein [Gemmatimonadota bacterium]